MRTAIVTGAARGIGAATAHRLAADGLAVAIIDLDQHACDAAASAIRKVGGTAAGFAADVADAASTEGAVRAVERELGTPHVLVNNAGVLRDNLLFKMSESDWDTVLSVHLRGSFLMTRAVQGYMVDARWGRIINLSSTSALGNRGQANYAAAKAGIQGFTKTLAVELGPFGITSNAVAPGFIQTDMTRATAERMGLSFEELIAHQIAQVPVRRAGVPEDIASAVSFFAKEDSSFINGQVLYVSGGPQT